MIAREVPSGTSNGPVTVEFSGERYLMLQQEDKENRDKDLIVIGIEHVAELAETMQAVAASATPQAKRGIAWYHALPAGEESAPIELGINHGYRGRDYVLLRQIDGADEGGELTNSTLTLAPDQLDRLISTLHLMKGLLG